MIVVQIILIQELANKHQIIVLFQFYFKVKKQKNSNDMTNFYISYTSLTKQK